MKSIELIKRGTEYRKAHGSGRLVRKTLEHGQRLKAEAGYESWLSAHLPSLEELKRQRAESEGKSRRFSVLVPVYRTPEKFLREMIESVLNQSYGNLELCLADGSGGDDTAGQIIRGYMRRDSRVKYRALEVNGGISENTNAALEMAGGDFVCLLDHDDLLAPDALYELNRMLERHPGMDVVYTDEDKVDFEGGKHFQPHFKPDFNLDLLRSNNYICHLFCVRRTLAQRAGGFCREYDGAQDYDFILRCAELAEEIGHVARILYHWRCHAASTAANPGSKQYAYEAGRRAVRDHLKRCGVKALVKSTDNPGFYRVRYELTEAPHVTMIVQGDFTAADARWLRNRLRAVTDYPDFDVYAGREPGKKIRERLKAVQKAAAEGKAGNGMLLFLNRRCFPVNRDWLRELVSHGLRADAGCVTGRIYDRNRRLLHAGETLGMYGLAAACPFQGYRNGFYGYMHKIGLQQNCSAVAGECLLVSERVLLEVESERQPGPAGEDGNGPDIGSGLKKDRPMEKFLSMFSEPGWTIELCLRAAQLGFRNIYTPYALLELSGPGAEVPELTGYAAVHGAEDWAESLCLGDPYYNRNLSRQRGWRLPDHDRRPKNRENRG